CLVFVLVYLVELLPFFNTLPVLHKNVGDIARYLRTQLHLLQRYHRSWVSVAAGHALLFNLDRVHRNGHGHWVHLLLSGIVTAARHKHSWADDGCKQPGVLILHYLIL